MLKTAITPKQAMISLIVPNRYIGKKVEVLLYISEEVEKTQQPQQRNVAQFKGLLTNEEANQYHQYLQTAREEWNRNI